MSLQSPPAASQDGAGMREALRRACVAGRNLAAELDAVLADGDCLMELEQDDQAIVDGAKQDLAFAEAALNQQEPQRSIEAERMPERAGEPRKWFPVLSSGGQKVDWQLVADHGKQAQTNHYQTVEKLASRGGLSWCELHAVLHNRPYQKMDQNTAILECRALEARYLAALSTPPSDNGQGLREAPPEAMWGGLARDIMMWLDMNDKTPRALFKHLKTIGREIPDWLRDEPEMKALDHVPSKGTRCVLIYHAMEEARAALSGSVERKGEG